MLNSNCKLIFWLILWWIFWELNMDNIFFLVLHSLVFFASGMRLEPMAHSDRVSKWRPKTSFWGNLIVFIIAVFGSSLERSKRQDYNTEQYDSVVGAYLAECTFYGDYTCDCKGRLTCRPGDVEERPTTAMLDRTCPQTSGTKTGKWERDQGTNTEGATCSRLHENVIVTHH